MDGVTEYPLDFGVRFRPSDEEIMSFLLRKVTGKPIPSNLIVECDIYGGDDRWRNILLEQGFDQNTAYFFSKLKNKSSKGSRIDRVAPCGTWKETQGEKKIFRIDNGQKVVIGSKRGFKLLPKTRSNISGRWLMDEFRLHDPPKTPQLDTIVLCKIKHKPELKSKTIKLEQHHEASSSPSTLTSTGSDQVQSPREVVSLPSMTTAASHTAENSFWSDKYWKNEEWLESIGKVLDQIVKRIM